MRPSSPYLIRWSAPASRDMERLPEKVIVAVVEFAHGPIAEQPTVVGRPLRWDLEGSYAARRGEYRIVYRIEEDPRVVIIEEVGHRADVYRPR